MADKPILFSGPMVRALLAGTKTQTRRQIKPRPWNAEGDCVNIDAAKSAAYGIGADGRHYFQFEHPLGGPLTAYVSRIGVGDRLYVREAWRTDTSVDHRAPRDLPHRGGDWTSVHYEADGHGPGVLEPGKFRQAMHMPRWASRLTLTVADVRVERLQDITEADALAEGMTQATADAILSTDELQVYATTHIVVPQARGRILYETIWDQINGDGAWAKNPWVAAYTFTVQRGNIDKLAGAA